MGEGGGRGLLTGEGRGERVGGGSIRMPESLVLCKSSILSGGEKTPTGIKGICEFIRGIDKFVKKRKMHHPGVP
jgi:hypothetical protein